MTKGTSCKTNNELLSLMNVGAATCKDLQLLEIDTIHQLANACPDELYARLQRITGQSHDPCVWDIFAAAINEARTGKKQPWWEYTKIRKKRQLEGICSIVKARGRKRLAQAKGTFFVPAGLGNQFPKPCKRRRRERYPRRKSHVAIIIANIYSHYTITSIT